MASPVIGTSENPVARTQAVTDIIESIALEETGLANIINAEGEKIQAVVANNASTTDELIKINDSVKETLKNIVKVQMLLQFKLEEIEKFKDDTGVVVSPTGGTP